MFRFFVSPTIKPNFSIFSPFIERRVGLGVGAKMKLSLVVLLVFALALCGSIALATTDPELKQCRHQCKVQRQISEEEKERCLKQCEDYHREKMERKRERGEGEGEAEEEERRGSRDVQWEVKVTYDPEQRLRECQKQCERQEGDQRSHCRLRCQERYERERQRGGEGEEEEERGRRRDVQWEVKVTHDPEKRLRECQKQCERQEGEQRSHCRLRCEERYERERQRGGREEEEEEEERRHRRDDESEVTVTDDPGKRLRQCQKQCEGQEGRQRSLCRLRCQQRYERERERGEGEEEGRHYGREEQREEIPYVFEDRHFTSRVRTQHGRVDVLKRFSEKSKLLRGIENYRVAILEANPQTFTSPNHWDADGVLFVAKGRGTITMIHEKRRESFNIEYGDVIRVCAGTPVYLINKDENEKLLIVNFLRPINLPGEYEVFHGAGGESPESFYRAFSWELLEAALKTDRRRLEQIFNQRQGAIVKASKEQIRAMGRREEGGGIWPFGGEPSSAFNLLHERPVHSNDYGQLFEAKPKDHKQQLQDIDIAITIANITRGSMLGPYYNSKSTKISIVLDGEGYFEMACPHVGSGGRSGRGSSYEKIRSEIRQGTVFVVPAGHPVAFVGSRNNNLVLLCFEVNAQGNTRYPLAGRNNIVNKIEREAKELGFGVRARDVEDVFDNQDEELFFRGPRGQQMEGHAFA